MENGAQYVTRVLAIKKRMWPAGCYNSIGVYFVLFSNNTQIIWLECHKKFTVKFALYVLDGICALLQSLNLH